MGYLLIHLYIRNVVWKNFTSSIINEMGKRKSFTHTILFVGLNDAICKNKTSITIIFYHAKYPISSIPAAEKGFHVRSYKDIVFTLHILLFPIVLRYYNNIRHRADSQKQNKNAEH